MLLRGLKEWVKKRWQSLKVIAVLNTAQPTTQEPEADYYALYTSCKGFPLEHFQTCLIDKDLTSLVKTGVVPDDDTLQHQWLSIYSDYSTLIGGFQIQNFIAVIGKKIALESKINRVQGLIDLWNQNPAPILLDALRDSGYKVDAHSYETVKRSLAIIESKLRTDTLAIQKLERELPKEDGEKQPPTREDFAQNDLACQEYLHLPYIPDMDTYTYCMRMKRLYTHFEKLKANDKK